jgi:hypothetical protein
MRRNAFLKNSKKSEVVYVIGNGPSLNNFKLDGIFGSDVITMNHFRLHPGLGEFNIVAHCVGEPYDCPTWEDPSEIVSGTPAETYWFNVSASDFCIKRFQDKNLHFYLPGVDANLDVLQGANLSKPTLNYQSTSQMAIMVAMHLGYKCICLVGFDHDWLTTRGYSPHFYNEDSDDVVVPKADFSGISYMQMINTSKNLFEIYGAIKNISARCGVRIVNLSEPTYLDVFDRVR